MTTEEDIRRVEGRVDRMESRIDRLQEHLDMKFDGITTTLSDITANMLVVNKLLKAVLWFCALMATGIVLPLSIDLFRKAFRM